MINRYDFVICMFEEDSHISESNDGEYVKYNEIIKPENIIEILKLLNDEERLKIFNKFCRECGQEQSDRRCQCWNDE